MKLEWIAAMSIAVWTSFAVPASAQTPAFDACLLFDRAACSAVLSTEPDNLTALFMRGLAAELVGDDAAALADFDATAARKLSENGGGRDQNNNRGGLCNATRS